jgi:raffinose/stachyose/melibiose transport system permease protein
MAHKRSTLKRVGNILALVALSVLLLIMLFPLAMIVLTSLKTETEYYANGPMSLPERINLEILRGTWERTEYTRKLVNSTFISVTTALLATGLSLLNAFALGIGKVKGRALVLLFFMIAMTLPGEALIYPLYYLFKLIKLYDNPISVILILSALSSSFGTYLLTSVFSAFNREIIEAAMIDGCNKIRLLFNVVMPVSMPALSVLFVFFFVGTWNEFFMALILLISSRNYTVPVAMALARGERNLVVTTQSAAGLLGILPCLIFFIIFQRTLTRGVTAGSIK